MTGAARQEGAPALPAALAAGPGWVATVRGREQVGPGMTRVVLGDLVPTPADGPPFASTGVPDEFFRLTLPAGPTTPCGSGPGGSSGSAGRYYTVRHWDRGRGQLWLDVVLHGHGPAARWASQVAAGARVHLGAPRGHYAPPAGVAWVALVGDATALPAVARIVEATRDTGGGPPLRIAVQVDEVADRQDLALRDGDDLRWLPAGAGLLEAVTDLVAAPGAGYLWFAGEASVMRAVRRLLRHQLGWSADRYTTMAYWRHDPDSWERRVRGAGPELARGLERIWADGSDGEVQRDSADALLARFGL